MSRIVLCTLILAVVGPATNAWARNEHLELAAKINTAENICDINFGKGLLHHVYMAAHEMGVTVEVAARMADARQAEIVRYLNKHQKLDEFCLNAKSGKL